MSQLPEGMKVESFGEELDAGPHSFSDTAAIMENLDLIITSDTSIAHLAGALGRPTWVALNHVPDWRWLLEGSVCPWYPTMRLFRQKTRDNWNAVFAEIEQELRLVIGSKTAKVGLEIRPPQTPTVKISWGELFDKITILELKRNNIQSIRLLENVQKELRYLLRISENELLENESLNALKIELGNINYNLWVVEDNIRDKERHKKFDQEFIGLARSVYKLNDKRAELKKRINIEMSSEIIEEKSYSDY